jgi:excisionase family DNA binding protein
VDDELRRAIDKLTSAWKDRAQEFNEHECGDVAASYLRAASELETTVARWENAELTVAEAADQTGYTEEHLRRLVRDGKLPADRANGARSHIKIRRADLRTKPNGRPLESDKRNGDDTYDPDEDARSIAKHLGR